MLTLVMYHYVRDLTRSRHPRIKGRTIESFDGQLDYIAANYRVCKLADVVAAVRGQRPLPDRACVLTFDDGFRDHFDVVFPRLRVRGWTGAFFPPAQPIENRRVLDVHKLHFVLADCSDADTMALLKEASCALGLTTRVGINADLTRPLKLRRLDTNDLPCFAGNSPAAPREPISALR